MIVISMIITMLIKIEAVIFIVIISIITTLANIFLEQTKRSLDSSLLRN